MRSELMPSSKQELAWNRNPPNCFASFRQRNSSSDGMSWLWTWPWVEVSMPFRHGSIVGSSDTDDNCMSPSDMLEKYLLPAGFLDKAKFATSTWQVDSEWSGASMSEVLTFLISTKANLHYDSTTCHLWYSCISTAFRIVIDPHWRIDYWTIARTSTNKNEPLPTPRSHSVRSKGGKDFTYIFRICRNTTSGPA